MSAQDPVAMLDAPTAGGKVIRGSVFRIGGHAAGVLFGVLAASLMIRHLGVVDWGRYVTVISLVTIVGGLSEAGLSSIGVREYATREGPERDQLMRNLLGLRLAITLVGVGAALIFASAAGYAPVLLAGTTLAGLGLLATVAQQMYMIPLSTALRIGLVSALDLARQVLTVLAIVFLVVAGAGLLPFLAASLPVSVVVLAATIVLVRNTIPFLPAFEIAKWWGVLRLTIAYSAAAAVASIYASVTVLIMSLLASAKELGYYGASFRIFSVLAALPLLAVNLAFPILARAARDDEARLKYAMQRMFETAVIFGTWLSLATGLGARFAIDVVAGAKFHSSVAVLQIQGAALVFTFLTVTWGTGLLAMRRHRPLLVANALGLGATVLLSALLIPDHGAEGAAIATLAGEFVLVVAYSFAVLVLDRRLRVSLSVVPRVVVAAGAALAVALVPGLHSVWLVTAASLAFFLVLWILRGIPTELHEAFLQGGGRGEP